MDALIRFGGRLLWGAAVCALLLSGARDARAQQAPQGAPSDRYAICTSARQASLPVREASAVSGLCRSVAEVERAIAARDPARNPRDWASLHYNLGLALFALGARDDDAALRDSLSAYRQAALYYPREREPVMWAAAQVSMAGVLLRLGGEANLRQAAAAARSALAVLPRAPQGDLWAAAQQSLGRALTELAGPRCETSQLREAVQAFRLALELHPRWRDARTWAAMQTDLAQALSVLGACGDEAALRDAVGVFRAALEVFTRADYPDEWAQTQGELGAALVRLAERGDTAAAQDAAAALSAALSASEQPQDRRTRWRDLLMRVERPASQP
jgi:tetratricopeptide (TPR) repeat protein